MADAFLTATDKQIGTAFTRAVAVAQGWSAQLDRSSSFDQAALAGFSLMTSLVKDQLEYLLDRNYKRDPDGLLAAFTEQLSEYRGFIQECIMPVQETQVQRALEHIGIEEPVAAERYYLNGRTFDFHLHLRSCGIDSRFDSKTREITVPSAELQRAELLEKLWLKRPTDAVADGKAALSLWAASRAEAVAA